MIPMKVAFEAFKLFGLSAASYILFKGCENWSLPFEISKI